MQILYSVIQLIYAVIIFFIVIRLENNSFLRVFQLDKPNNHLSKKSTLFASIAKKESLLNSKFSESVSQRRPDI
jgi:hypothetical protein